MAYTEQARAELAERAGQIIARYPKARSALLPLLHLVQAREGYVSDDGIAYCAERLGLTEADVTAVVSFYTMYKRAPVGEYHVGVCTNTLCAIMGGDVLFAELKNHLGVDADEPTGDGKVSIERIECNAGCDYAPVIMVNWEFYDNMTPESARDLVDGLRSGDYPAPSRGAERLVNWREAAMILAGFPDDQATSGHTAGGPTIAGLRIAKENGWTPANENSNGARN
ncbi:MAG TPA: NADH-quinone oxidoreductase subunit NuoE [Streptosporangiaceae bacterium]|nr:NADH-quinone oxidoreductase subunit NuoE [Streptosporangiaceae bacterium]